MSDTIIPLVGPEPLSEAWHELRTFNPKRKGREIVFGATKAAAICGQSPYSTPYEVFVECLVGVKREPNDVMLNGLDYEDAVLNIYERTRKCVLDRKLPMYFHGQYPWMGATPDALARWKRGPEYPMWGVDAKTSTYRRLDKDGDDPLKFGVEGTDQLPVDYIFQAQQQCAVLNLPFVEFPVSFSRDYQPIYRVERNEDLIKFIIFAEQEMYQRLVNNDPPEPNWEHQNTREMIALAFGRKEELVIELDGNDVERWLEVQRKSDEMKALDEHIKAEKNKLLFKMGAAAYGRFPSGDQQLKRIVVKDSLWTQKDVDDAKANIGQTKRKGHERLMQTKVKD
jgi:predicted phage-related endonuclease